MAKLVGGLSGRAGGVPSRLQLSPLIRRAVVDAQPSPRVTSWNEIKRLQTVAADPKEEQMCRKGEVAYQPLPLPDRVQLVEAEAVAAAVALRDCMRERHSVRHYDRQSVPEVIISACIEAAASAPAGANRQPWHFVAISDPAVKARIRAAAEEEEKDFYAGGGGDEWVSALEPIGTPASKPHLTDAPWLIVVFAQRCGVTQDGTRYKNYDAPESVGIATGFLIAALHHAGLVCLVHTPNPIKFLPELCGRPDNDKAVMILHVGYPALDATVPAVAKRKNPSSQIMTILRPFGGEE